MNNPSENKRFYGTVTVSDRGQIVIPAEARRDFNIEVGDKMLVLGDLEQGLALIKATSILEKHPGMFTLIQQNAQTPKGKENE